MIDARLLGAVYRMDETLLRTLIQEGVELRAKDEDGHTVLMHVVLASDASAEWIRLLAGFGLDPNVADRDQRWTALHFAARDRKLEIVRALLELGAEVDALDVFGNTPLWRAVMSSSTTVDVEQLLIDAGANPDLVNLSGVSPRLLAERLGHRLTLSRKPEP